MTSRQIKVLNNMANHNSSGSYSVVLGGQTITISVSWYDPMTNQGVWTLSYLSYSVELHSDKDIPSYDSNILRLMYTMYIYELKDSLINTMSN